MEVTQSRRLLLCDWKSAVETVESDWPAPANDMMSTSSQVRTSLSDCSIHLPCTAHHTFALLAYIHERSLTATSDSDLDRGRGPICHVTDLDQSEWSGSIPTIQLLPRSWSLSMQLPTPLVFTGCLISNPITLPKRRIICGPVFEQINTCYTTKYFTQCILSETQKEINILNNKQIKLNNTADTINKHTTHVIWNFELFIKTNVYAKPFWLIWLIVIGYMYK